MASDDEGFAAAWARATERVLKAYGLPTVPVPTAKRGGKVRMATEAIEARGYTRAIADVRERVLSMVTPDGMSEGQRDAYCLALLDVQRVLDEVRDGE